jgi:hypothetical protein
MLTRILSRTTPSLAGFVRYSSNIFSTKSQALANLERIQVISRLNLFYLSQMDQLMRHNHIRHQETNFGRSPISRLTRDHLVAQHPKHKSEIHLAYPLLSDPCDGKSTPSEIVNLQSTGCSLTPNEAINFALCTAMKAVFLDQNVFNKLFKGLSYQTLKIPFLEAPATSWALVELHPLDLRVGNFVTWKNVHGGCVTEINDNKATVLSYGSHTHLEEVFIEDVDSSASFDTEALLIAIEENLS